MEREQRAIKKMLSQAHLNPFDEQVLKDVQQHFEDEKMKQIKKKEQKAEMARFWKDQINYKIKTQR